MFPAVKDVSFCLHEGETLGLVGESGCGKSTLAKLIVRLLWPDAGEILFEGENMGNMTAEQFRRIRPQLQLIQQNPFNCMDPRMKIKTILSEGVKAHQISTEGLSMREYLMQMLKSCDLEEEYLERYPNEFSGGQLQRLAIARAMLLKPRVIIADEIVSALDISVQSQILNLLLKLKEERKLSVIFITHDLCVVKKIADRILVMKDGMIVDSGNGMHIFETSQCDYTRELREAIVPFPY